MDALRTQLGAFLRANGPKRRDALRRAIDIDDAKLDEVLDHEWFEKDGGMYTLSSDGHVRFRIEGRDD